MNIFCSIIIPFNNSKKTLKKCILSVLNQQGKINYEIIIIDDFSNDGSKQLCDKLIKKKNNCKILKSKTKTIGPGHARNIGLKYAKGKYILFIDSDDAISRNAIRIFYDKSKNANNPDIICANFKVIDKVGNFKKKNRNDLKFYKKSKKSLLLNFFNLSIIPQVISNLISKKIIDKNNIKFQKGLFEDIYFYFKILFFSKKIKILNDKIYFKFNRKNSIVNSLTQNHITDSFNSYYKCYKFLINKNFFRKSVINKYFLVAITGQVAVFFNRILESKKTKTNQNLRNLLKKTYFKMRRRINFDYFFQTKKDIIAKNFLYDIK